MYVRKFKYKKLIENLGLQALEFKARGCDCAKCTGF